MLSSATIQRYDRRPCQILMRKSHNYHRHIVHRTPNEAEMEIINNPLHDTTRRAKLFVSTYGNTRHQLRQSLSIDSKHEEEQKQNLILENYDYQAPLSAHSLKHNSKWLIIRRNLHRIRSMDGQQRTPNIYLSFQMIRELQRAQSAIKNIDHDNTHYHKIKKFSLAVNKQKVKTYDVTHITPDDALFYDRLGDEP
ncbi:unnamed protein product, partial [Didymodactylos carnosus]